MTFEFTNMRIILTSKPVNHIKNTNVMQSTLLQTVGQQQFCLYFSREIKIHWSKQLKSQPILLLSFFVHNSSINEHKNMKLRENTYYEKVN